MKKELFLFLFIFFCLTSCKSNAPDQVSLSAGGKPVATGEFCGISSGGSCGHDGDCKVGGCSNQICYAQSEGEPITTCEHRDCFNAKAFGVQCRCIDEKCQWK